MLRRIRLGSLLLGLLLGGSAPIAEAQEPGEAAPPANSAEEAASPAGQEEPPPPAPSRPAAEPGTHFLLELGLGSTAYGGGGLATTATVGGGGRVFSTPLRWYLLAEMTLDRATTTGVSRLGLDFSDDRHFVDVGGGLRLYLPLYRSLRLFVDGVFGATYLDAQLDRQTLPLRQAAGWEPLGQLGCGLQLRFQPNLSVGLRARWDVLGGDLAGLYAMAGQPAPTRSAALASLTWHF